ncbi:hypothetical protein ACHAWO_003666 [Cyclotella atomus]|uniref:Uncharacterized protein n=1 Tax=Cyclotella atomus TaxID=382360 RepID=A0ABD3PG42_9STRA
MTQGMNKCWLYLLPYSSASVLSLSEQELASSAAMLEEDRLGRAADIIAGASTCTCIVPQEEGGVEKVFDFGLARHLQLDLFLTWKDNGRYKAQWFDCPRSNHCRQMPSSQERAARNHNTLSSCVYHGRRPSKSLPFHIPPHKSNSLSCY